jgi:hypothetical protein
MQVRTNRSLGECVAIFQESVRKRPLKLKMFPFRCDTPQITDNMAVVAATFQIAEPYGSVRMQCERRDGVTHVDFFTDGNIRGKVAANSMVKAIVAKLG